MANLQSPGVQSNEVDLTIGVSSVSISDGAIGGVFRWGPIDQPILVDSEDTLSARFGKPSNFNAETWFTGASFLGYSDRLFVSRAGNTAGVTPTVTGTVSTGNATVVLSSGNTQGLEAGMIVISTLGGSLSVGATVNNVINTTAFGLSSGSMALVNAVGDTIQFVSDTVFSAVGNTGPVANLEYTTIKNEDEFTAKEGTFDPDVHFIARYPGALGNSIRVSICGNSSGYQSTIDLSTFSNAAFTVVPNSNTTTVSISATSNTAAGANATSLKLLLDSRDKLEIGNTMLGFQYLTITEVGSTTVTGNATQGTATFTVKFEDVFVLAESFTYSGANTQTKTVNRFWEFHNYVDGAPAQSNYQISLGNSAVNSDEMHVVVTDEGGLFTGVPGTVLETYRAVSRATDAKTIDGGTNFWKKVINDASQYIWVANDISTAPSGTAINLVNSTLDTASIQLAYGRDGKDEVNVSLGTVTRAYQYFQNKEDFPDVALIMQGRARSFNLANWLIDNIAEHESRKDCVVFVSPQKSDVVNNIGNEYLACIAFRKNLRASSYGVMDSGYKYMYDKYNDVFRWVPLNGDIAGLCARTDTTNDPWWSPAGFSRGHIKNIAKLAWTPRQSYRDELYKNDINPVVNFPGDGIVLYGDKTLLGKESAFSRINVRRLFIVLKKAISKAARNFLFEFNDPFTRASFRSMVVPYMREIQARRGVTDFRVVCDETNNTSERIDRNEFYGDVYVKPNRSINFVYLNFVAVRSSVSFEEVIGNW